MKTNMLKHFSFFLLTVGFFFNAGIVRSQVSPKYNILFIAVDDMNDRVSFLGNSEVVTPNLQRLVARGMVFKNAYSQYPLCSPSRTSLLTGWRPDKTKIVTNTIRPRSVIGTDVKFLPEYFKQYGYHTERYGKIMHNLYENDIKWDYAEPPEKNNAATASTDAPATWWVRDIIDTSQTAIDLVARMQKPQILPFFYALGLYTHNPFTPAIKYWNMNGDPSIQELLPINANGTLTDLKGNGSGNIILPSTPLNDRDDVPPIAFTDNTVVKTDYEWKKTIHAYDGEVAQMDANLGLVLDEMDRQNLWDNTIVVFWSDHGQHLGEHEGLWLKMTLFEESLHIPLIICVPGKPAGECSRLVELEDLYPTLAELCGLPPPPGMQGWSFAPLLDNSALPWKRAVFSQVKRSSLMGRSVRTEQYRYNSWGASGEELYDHNVDPHEYTNLAGNPNYSQALNEMRAILAEGWTKSVPPPHCPTAQTFYLDNDGDGYGNSAVSVQACSAPAGFAVDNTDCDDNNANSYPGASEICGNNIDDNCNAQIDEGCSNTCTNATGLTTTNIMSTTATLNWTASVNPAKWQLQYEKTITGATWTNIKLTGSPRSVNISSLTANQKYKWHIRALCGTTWTAYSAAVNFTTLLTSQANSAESLTMQETGIEKSSILRLYPNPSRGQFIVDLYIDRNSSTKAKIELFTIMGQNVYKESASISGGRLQKSVSIPSSLLRGVYLVKITAYDKTYVAMLAYVQ